MPETSRLFKDGVEMSSAWSEGVGLSQALAYVPVPSQMRLRIKQGTYKLWYSTVSTLLMKLCSAVLGCFRRAINEEYIQGVVELAELDSRTTPTNVNDKETSSDDQENIKTEDSATSSDDEATQPTTNIKNSSNKTTIKEEPSTTKDTNEKVTVKAPPAQRIRTRGCSKLQLLLSPAQLVAEGYPLPGYGLKGFRFTKDTYQPVSEKSRMYSIDCEWCICIDGKSVIKD